MSVPHPSSQPPVNAGTERACLLQVMLLTYQPSALANDIFHAAASLAEQRPDVQVVVAWGGEPGACEDRWRASVADWRDRGAQVLMLAHPSPLERVRLSLEQASRWVLPLADDDPIAVNYLRVMADAVGQAEPSTAGVVASNHLRIWDAPPVAMHMAGWPQPDGPSRLLSMLARPGDLGTLFWAAYRQEVLAAWLDIARALPFQPSYLDQFLPLVAAVHGRIVATAEPTVLMKDDAHWQDEAAAVRTNARYYPHPEMALYHEWFWAADLWRALSGVSAAGNHAVIAPAVKQWAQRMVGRLAGAFEARRAVLDLQLGPAHAGVLAMLKVVAGWLAEDVDDGSIAAGLDEVAHMAHEVRSRWLAAGEMPDFRDELAGGSVAAVPPAMPEQPARELLAAGACA